MQIDRAMSLLLAGYSVRRNSWIGREDAEGKILDRAIVPTEHGFFFSGRRTIFGREQDFALALFLQSADLAADDWEVASLTAPLANKGLLHQKDS